MGPLTEGKTRHAKKKIKHNEGVHTQTSLHSIILDSLLFGGACTLVASTFNFLVIVYIVSIAVSFGAMYLLPKFKSINITHARNMKQDALVLWFILFLGPIMTIFTLTMLLLPPKKSKAEASDETK